MIKAVDQIQVADIFSTNSDKIYNIPKYQREYTWGKPDWDALFTDVMENEKGYFLGSFICVNAGSLGGTFLELIDGQQRFSSLTLLLAALYEKLYTHKEEMDEEERLDLLNLHKEIAFKREKEYIPRLNLQKQNYNDLDYSYVLYNAQIITTPFNKPNNFGYRRISKAYRHFGELIEDEISRRIADGEASNEIAALFDIKKKFEKAILVGIEVDTNKDAYMLFESLNHRGVPLSALDLIKNTLIAQATSESEADSSYEKWKTILTLVGSDDYAMQERFFRQYYNAFREELNANVPNNGKKYPLGYLATKTTLIDIYEKMIRNDCQNLLDDLLVKAEKYSVIVNNDISAAYSDSLIKLERISGAPSYILLLYLLSNQNELDLSDDDIDWIIRALIIFFVRRNVTDVPGTRKLIQFFIDCVLAIRDLAGISIRNVIREKLRDASAPDSVFIEKLSGDIYDENAEAARFILCDIEERHQTKETFTNLWEREGNNKYIWTIEHIFPEGENVPKVWVDMIANGNVELAKQYREEYVHKLGNLTITGYNSNLSNKSFFEKKERKSKDNKVLGYRNGLYLNEDVVCEDSWTIDKIMERTARLVEIAQSIYSWNSI